MAQSLYDLLHQCTVIVTTDQNQGTGFFVAPGLVLTCAHVVEDAQQNNISVAINWKAKEQKLPAQIKEFRDVTKTDLALLKVDLIDNPCVLLFGGAEPRNFLYSFGYPDIEPEGSSTTFECEGWAGNQQAQLRLKQGQARYGMSGSPLLNWETGGVCGIVQITRDANSDLGGKALLASIILQEFSELEALQKQYHLQYHQWIDSLDAVQRPRLKLPWLTPPSSSGAIEVFISYAQKDKKLYEELTKHLKQMKRDGLITGYDHNIDVGTEQEEEAKKRLSRARIILLLVSPDYLASDYHYDVEMKQALERHKAGAARVIPIMLRHTAGWESTEFAKLRSLPRDNDKTVDDLHRDKAFSDIAREIRGVVEQLTKNPS